MSSIKVKEEPEEDLSTFVEDGLLLSYDQIVRSNEMTVKAEYHSDPESVIPLNSEEPSCSEKDSTSTSIMRTEVDWEESIGTSMKRIEVDYGNYLLKNILNAEMKQRVQEYFTKLNLLPLNLTREEFQNNVDDENDIDSSEEGNDSESALKEKTFAGEIDYNIGTSILENITKHIQLNKTMESFMPLGFSDCSSIFTNDKLDLSQIRPHLEGKNVHKCLECETSYSRKFNLTRHILAVHKKEKPLKCPDCENSFKLKKELAIHLRLVHDSPKKLHKCFDCDEKFSQKEQLAEHKRLVHGNERPFKCLDCNNSYSRKFNLTRHISSVHKKMKPFKCSECDSTFSLKNHLDRHIQSIHENTKPYKCYNCDSAFNRKEHLSQHITLVHRDIAL